MMSKVLIVIALMSVYVTSWAERPEALNFPLDYELLEKGKMQAEVQLLEEPGRGEKKLVIGVQLINATADQTWALVRDVEGQINYVPNLELFDTVHTFEKTNTYRHILANIKLDVPIVNVQYTLDYHIDDTQRLHYWTMLTPKERKSFRRDGIKTLRPGFGLTAIKGLGYIEPYEKDPSKSLYYYLNDITSSMPVPGMLERALTKSTLREYMLSIRVVLEGDHVLAELEAEKPKRRFGKKFGSRR
jgi:hypothetical protein